MGSKPKKSEYEPSDAEKASAAVAMAEHKYFKEKYDPLLQKMRDASKVDDSAQVLRARANADTMQTLAGKASYAQAKGIDGGGEMAQAYQAQLGQADKAGLNIKNQMQLGVLGTARGQAADAQTGMAAAADMGTSRVLSAAKAKQQEREARNAAIGQIGTSLLLQGAENMKSEVGKQHLDTDTNKMVPTTYLDGPNKGKQIMEKGSFFAPAGGRPNLLDGLFNFGG